MECLLVNNCINLSRQLLSIFQMEIKEIMETQHLLNSIILGIYSISNNILMVRFTKCQPMVFHNTLVIAAIKAFHWQVEIIIDRTAHSINYCLKIFYFQMAIIIIIIMVASHMILMLHLKMFSLILPEDINKCISSNKCSNRCQMLHNNNNNNNINQSHLKTKCTNRFQPNRSKYMNW